MKIFKTLLFFLFNLAVLQSQTDMIKPVHNGNNNNIAIQDSSSGKIRIINSTGNTILEINDESNGGSISLPTLSSIGNFNNKLYNLGNMLYWNDQPIAASNSGNGWNLINGKIFLSDPSFFVGIGTQNPEQKLHIENGGILVTLNSIGLPGMTIKNDVGRSILHLRGSTNINNLHSDEILLEDITTGKIWSLLNTNTNSFSVLNHLNYANYASPFEIKFGAPTNSLTISTEGNVGIGTWSTDHKLAVAGSIISEEVIVKLQSNWPDYVFDGNYELPDLNELKEYIDFNHHLKGLPPAAEIKNNGINIAEIQIKLLQKIEELTLFIIKQDNDIKNLSAEVEHLKDIIGDHK